jgi:hypothetical protein
MSKHVTISPSEVADRLAIRELVEAYAHCASYKNSRFSTIAVWCLRATPSNIIAFSGAMLSGS